MLGCIYIVKNDVNNLVYIGQTIRGIYKRFAEHIIDSIEFKDESKFHRAMRDIGVEHFYISEICRCDSNDLNSLEIYYIQKYNSYYNGYNSTPGGAGCSGKKTDIDIDKFMIDCHRMSIIDLSLTYKVSVQTIISIIHCMGIDRSDKQIDKKYDYSAIRVFCYDKQFNFLHEYESITQARKALNLPAYAYWNIKQAIHFGSIAYGMRWQRKDDLRFIKDSVECYYNTIFDRDAANNGNKIYMDNYGKYRAIGLKYSDIVGVTALGVCKKCGSRLDKNGVCNKCHIEAKKKDLEDIKEYRVSKIRQYLNEEMNLSEIGKELNISANYVKRLCQEYNIEYKTGHKNETVRMVNPNNLTHRDLDIDTAVDMIIASGISTASKYSVKRGIRDAVISGKIKYGVYWKKL